jgi:hypothetical protein
MVKYEGPASHIPRRIVEAGAPLWASLDGTYLRGSYLIGADVDDADPRGAKLTRIHLRYLIGATRTSQKVPWRRGAS